MTLIAGSNTVKGTINDGMDVEFALKMGKALGTIYGSPIAVAMDGRNSNIMLKTALMAGIMSVGCNVHDLGPVPTPLIQFYMVMHPEVKGGVTITASFSRQEINGFRIMKANGIEDPIFDVHTVEEIMSNITQVPALQVGEIYVAADFTEMYIDYILSEVDEEMIRDAGLKICLDCRNPVVARIVGRILMRLSVECILLGGDTSVMDGTRLIKLGHVVKSQELDLGVALEMDADHCLFTTEEGDPVQGDKTFAVLVKSILSENKGKVVMPINSSTLMEDVVRQNGGLVLHCTIGEQTVVRKVKENQAVLGGDIFGCIVIPGPFCTCDSIEGMVRMLAIVAEEGPLSQLIKDFPNYYISRASMDHPVEDIPRLLQKFKEANDGCNMDLTDGVKVYRDKGWVLVRQSNVRNVVKIYSQADSKECADKWVQDTIEKLNGFGNLSS